MSNVCGEIDLVYGTGFPNGSIQASRFQVLTTKFLLIFGVYFGLGNVS